MDACIHSYWILLSNLHLSGEFLFLSSSYCFLFYSNSNQHTYFHNCVFSFLLVVSFIVRDRLWIYERKYHSRRYLLGYHFSYFTCDAMRITKSNEIRRACDREKLVTASIVLMSPFFSRFISYQTCVSNKRNEHSAFFVLRQWKKNLHFYLFIPLVYL